ncbi:hypothetical protein GCM10011608_61400 [Micromonospora sonchi]|uniref:Uncharacterized protein n=1 Tax=Micromonospora sonchi TaxID=1763543 RepID=A0A917U991_9ACTN|nr:hypothetical protein [Micromonospora sonchi]GGM67907.1 hypothetical protein GCM10011608_61400 [Micromonospora sonchi]
MSEGDGASLRWESNASTNRKYTEVWVCLGYARPEDYSGRCEVIVAGN